MLSLLLGAAGAFAAPVPKDETGRIARVYGAVHDPDKGTEFRNVGDTLHVSVPIGPRLLVPFHHKLNAPRVWREVTGNFTVTVKVSFPIRSKVPAKDEAAFASRASGGLVVWRDDEHALTLTREESAGERTVDEYFRSECHNNGSVSGSADAVAPGKSGYLRVTRWEKGFVCSYSLDGKKWKPLGSYVAKWDETLKVGVFAENGFKAPFEVAFDEYTLTPTKE